MFRVSKDSPVYYLTSVTNNRLPVFRTAKLKDLMCDALNEARRSAGLLLFAYVIMPDHLHALIGSERKPSEVLRFVNGISGRRVLDFLKEPKFETSLRKLRRAKGVRDYQYSLLGSPSERKIDRYREWVDRESKLHSQQSRASRTGGMRARLSLVEYQMLDEKALGR